VGHSNAIDCVQLTASNELKQTTCPYCGVGCGIDINVTNDGQVSQLSDLKGTAEHPANFGRLCVKGSNLLNTLSTEGRLFTPEVMGVKVKWQKAIDTVADKFTQVINEHGPDAVAFYVSGQLLTEDYYVANKLMKGYIGSANIDTNSRLCMSSAVAAYKKSLGSDSVPCSYEDLSETDLLIMVGSNAAWTHPVLFQRIEKAKRTNPAMKVVFIDPRKTASCELADLHLPLKPGTDVALFNGLIQYLSQNDGLDLDFIKHNTNGFAQLISSVADCSIEQSAKYCDLDFDAVQSFYQSFTQSKKVITFYSMGVNQSTSGVDKASSIINCHLATGTIGKIGCGPFSITGQPNAMGGREVGGLANMLAAHMDIENAQHRDWVQSYWNSPRIANKSGLKAIDLFEQIEQGKIKALWIMATNPVASMPNRNKIESALRNCEMVVVSDCVATNDTLDFAHVKLPATGWSEKDGTVTNSERRISRQRGLLTPKGESKHDWQIICDVAQAMGFSNGFDYSHPQQIFCEHAGLSGFNNFGNRDFDISGLMHLDQAGYDRLSPIQWPVNQKNPSGTSRLFTDNLFYTEDKKANFIAVVAKPPEQITNSKFSFVLNSGRIRDQWHTMTRTGLSAQLTSHAEQAFLSIHPKDASINGLKNADLVAISSAVSHRQKSQVVLPIKITDTQRQNELFAPIHWSHTWSSSASIAHLYTDANDSQSGQPELKHAAVNIEKIDFNTFGELFSRDDISKTLLDDKFDYWVKIPIEQGFLHRFASDQKTIDLMDWFDLIFPAEQRLSAKGPDHIYYAGLRNNKLLHVAFTSDQPFTIERRWIENLFSLASLNQDHLYGLLRAQPDNSFIQGKLVCSCFNIAENAIKEAIKNGCTSVEELGEVLSCGTNCGSCKAELQQIIGQQKQQIKYIELQTDESISRQTL
jgi:assimilatory nitrate reductase catalytic subunit